MRPVGAGGAGPTAHPAQPGRGQRPASKSNKEQDETVRNKRVCLSAWTGVSGERTETEQQMSLCGHAFLLLFCFGFFFFLNEAVCVTGKHNDMSEVSCETQPPSARRNRTNY